MPQNSKVQQIKFTSHMEAVRQLVGKRTDDFYSCYTHQVLNPHVSYELADKGVFDDLVTKIQNSINVDEAALIHDYPFPVQDNPSFRFCDLFAGIGGIRMAFQEQGGHCVFSSEWNKFAQKTYAHNFGEVPFGDITTINEDHIPDHDVLVGGFPCQPFSIAGVSKKNSLGRHHGFLDKLQGNLFFDIVRIIDVKRPRMFLLENVKNLRSHDKGKTYCTIIDTLKKLDYTVSDKILDAKYYVPQHRERIYIVGFDNRHYATPVDFTFPEPDKEQASHRIGDILDAEVSPKYTLTDNLWKYLQAYAKKHQQKGNGFGFGMVDLQSHSRTLSARYYKDGSEILIPQGVDKNPRRLTPNECKRLMGFPEEYQVEDIGVSDMQLYKQFGNSVAVPVVRAIASAMLTHL